MGGFSAHFDFAGETMKEVTINSYGKINLSIDITGKMEDGYHRVEMIMHQIRLHDDVTLCWKPDGITGPADPGLAFWGEFAPGIADTDEPGWREKATDIREAAEKGIQTFLKAGEAFLKALGDDKGK